MNITYRFLVFQSLVVLPFLLGAGIRRIRGQSWATGMTKRLVNVNLVAIEPVVALWSTWGLVLTAQLAVLPVAGLILVSAGFLLGMAAGKVLGLDTRRKAAFHVSSSLSNHGFTMGAFFCYLVLGERGLGLSSVFLAYFMPFVFLVIFPYAHRKSSRAAGGIPSAGEFFLSLKNMPLYAVIGATVLLVLGIERPRVPFPLDAFIMLSMVLYYFALGLSFDPALRGAGAGEHAALFSIKFVAVPSLCAVVLACVHLDPAIETVILIQSFMPAAIYSVVAAVLFDLEAEFASTLFVVSTAAFIVLVLPVLWFAGGFLRNMIM